MTAQEALKQWIATTLRPLMRAHGYRAKGALFYRRVGENFAILDVQRHKRSTRTLVEFTINVSVFSARLHRGLAKYGWVPTIETVPCEPACHLRQRLGFLAPADRDLWWPASPDGVSRATSATITAMVERYALPFLATRVSDEGLRDHWLEALPRMRRGGHTLELAILVRDLNPRERLKPLLAELRERASPAASEPLDRFAKELRALTAGGNPRANRRSR